VKGVQGVFANKSCLREIFIFHQGELCNAYKA
jgi:hypothetical protein